MSALTNLNFYSYNVTIDTVRLVGGYVFVVSCDTSDTTQTHGDVVIDSLVLDGKRDVLFKYGGIYMTGPQNFTI